MRTSFLASVVAVTLAVLVLPQASHAGGGPKDHTGFFLRLAAGGGYVSTGGEGQVSLPPLIPPTVVDLTFSGVAGDFTVAVGGCVSEDLALHGTYWGWALSNPDVEFNDLEGELDGDLSMSAWGGGLTYYVMPTNLYLSASLGGATITLSDDDGEDTSDWGFAMDLSVGKEWWVGNSWGLGLAGVFGYHNIEEFSGYEVGLRFSATFN